MIKIKRCPNCGSEEAADARFCSECGTELDDEPIVPEFKDEFGSNEDGTNPAKMFPGQPNFVNGMPFDQTPTVATKIEPAKANKYKKGIYSWSILIVVASLLGFIFNLTALDDTLYIQSQLPNLVEEYYPIFKAIVDVYYAGIVLLAFMLVASIVLTVFLTKLNKFNFPVRNDDVFGVAQKAFWVYVAVAVLEVALFIVELISVIDAIQIQRIFNDTDMSVGTNAAYLVKDLVVLCGTVVAMIFTRKLATCKQD